MRNPTITILKAIAIVLVVVAHSCPPMYLSRFSYMICVSLFFMASGYCFDTKYLNDEATFVKRRFRGLYVPFVKWSLFFLLLNAFWFWTGLLNEHYGNAAGGVTHPLNLHNWLQTLWSIVLNMSGYDQFLCGAYWFFRALLVSSILFLAYMKLLDSTERLNKRHAATAAIVAVGMVGLALWQTSDGLRWTGIAGGGYRELMGTFFLCAGFLYRRFEEWNAAPASTQPVISSAKAKSRNAQLLVKGANAAIRGCETIVRTISSMPLVSMIISATVLALLVAFPHPTMAAKARTLGEVLWLGLSGVVGFSFIYNLSRILHRIAALRQPLTFIGDNTLYIFGWHMLAFKLASMIKVGVYGLPWAMVGSHPVVRIGNSDAFWILYTIVGITLPLGGISLLRYCRSHYNLDNYLQWARTGLVYLWAAISYVAKWSWHGLRVGTMALIHGIVWFVVKIWTHFYDFCITFVDTVKAGADVGQDKVEEDDDEEDDDEYDDDEEEYDEDDGNEDDDRVKTDN